MCEQGANYTTTEAMRDIVHAFDAKLPAGYTPGTFDRDNKALIIRNGEDGQRESAFARLGMPTPPARLKPGQRVDRGQVNIASLRYAHWWQFMGTAHRCVVPVTSFQERDTVNGSYRMIDFGLPDDTTFYLAGLWTTWTAQRSMAEGVVTTDGYATLTAPPNAEVAPYHERMPVVLLTEEGVKAWLSLPPERAILMQRSLPAGHLVVLNTSKNS